MPKLDSFPSASPAALTDVLAAIRGGANKTLSVNDILDAFQLLPAVAPLKSDLIMVSRGGASKRTTLSEALAIDSYRRLSGFEPDKFSTNVLNINPGSLSNSNGTTLYSSSAVFTVDLTINGAGGLDTGVVANGSLYYIYLIANNATGALSAVASTAIAYGGVTVPAGYTLVRKLPFGFPYDAVKWDGIPDFHVAHWPSPLVTFTAADESTNWRALNGGTANAWTDVDLSTWIPDNARHCFIMTRVAAPGAAGVGWASVRTEAAQGAGLNCGYGVFGGTPFTYDYLRLRVTSDRKIQYKCSLSSGANYSPLTIFVLGYSMTEPV